MLQRERRFSRSPTVFTPSTLSRGRGVQTCFGVTIFLTGIAASDIEPETYLTPTETSFSLKAPSLNVVYKLLSKLNERKSAGLDNIQNKLLKMAASIVSPSLALIFAKSIETGIFSDEWKLARVTPIFKKGKRDDPNNYRPISVIPTVAKIFEKCVCDQLSEYLNANNLLSHCQPGF